MIRSLRTIAMEIAADWRPVSPAAQPYLAAMFDLYRIEDRYGADSAKDVVLYFLANASLWRGPTARRVKAELKELVR